MAARSRPAPANITYSLFFIGYLFRFGSSSLLGGLLAGFFLGHASAAERVGEAIIRLVTRVLVKLALNLGDRHFSGPRLGPHPRILHRELVEDRLVIDAGEPFDDVQVLGSLEGIQIGEIGGIDHQRVPFPMAHRIAHPLTDSTGRVPASVGGNEPSVVDLLSLD